MLPKFRPGLFIFRLRTGSILPKFFAILSAVTQEGPYAAQMFRNIRTAVLSAITYDGTLMLPTLFEILVRFPILVVLPYAQGPCCPKLSEHGHASQLFVCMSHRVYAGQMCVELLTPFAYLIQCLKRV